MDGQQAKAAPGVKIAGGLHRVTDRPEYLAIAATGRKWVTPAFIIQARPSESDAPPRAGFTVSKKVGNSVIRNRARRRLKEAARAILPEKGVRGWEYVLVGRQAAVDYPFEKLKADIGWAVAKMASGADLAPPRPKGEKGEKSPKAGGKA